MVLLMLMCATGYCSPEAIIHSGDSVVSVEEMINALQEVDVVFVGEQHDDSFAHEWELFIWQSLSSNDRILALEMFETDVQTLLDSYLSGEVGEEDFLAGSRPWGNYQTDYAPMVQYALENDLNVIAANVPRMYAAMVARGGLDAIAGESELSDIAIDATRAGGFARQDVVHHHVPTAAFERRPHRVQFVEGNP